jgi:putative inorganic carbon (hco3(-)) transporter
MHSVHQGTHPPQSAQALLQLRPAALRKAATSQSWGFVALILYVMIEYVRPQSVWPALAFLPWGQLTFGAAILGALLERPPSPRTPTGLDVALGVFSTIVLASSAVAYDPQVSISWLYLYANWVLLYYVCVRLVTTPTRFFLLFLSFLLWSFKMSQFGAKSFVSSGFEFTFWLRGGLGWFSNSGELAIQMVVLTALSTTFIFAMRKTWPKWLTMSMLVALPGTALVTIIGAASRGSQLGVAAVMLMFLLRSKHRVRGLALLIGIAPILYVITPDRTIDRFKTIGTDDTSVSRLDYWRDGIEIIKDHPVLGIGYENWLPFYRRFYNPEGQLPHNIFVEAGAEMGILGLLALLALLAMTLITNARTRKLSKKAGEWGDFIHGAALGLDAALVGYVVSGLFVTVLFYPYLWFNLAMTASLAACTAPVGPGPQRRPQRRPRRAMPSRPAAVSGSLGTSRER